MSKLSFRARALDATKPMPVYYKHELSDLQDYSVLNRAVPQMPSGMEKEEESEHHLQRAISAQQVYGDAKVMVIPVPEAEISLECYNNLYKKSFKLPKHYVHNQAQALNSILDQERPDYDMDSDDETWLRATNKKAGLDITALQFEEMIDRLEKSCGTQMVPLQEAKLLLKEDDEVIKAVYEYWTTKRSREKGPLVFQVRQERRDGSSTNDCYVAFRRRTEKMQTRKNRKNDESSYEKMLKLRRDLSRAVTILEMVKRREKSKREHLHLTVEVFEKRYQMKDWDGKALRAIRKESLSQRARYRPVKRKRRISTVLQNALKKKQLSALPSISKGEISNRESKVIGKKLKKKRQNLQPTTISVQASNKVDNAATRSTEFNNHTPVALTTNNRGLSYQEVVDTMTQYEYPPSSDEDVKSPHVDAHGEASDAKKLADGIFTFRRKPGCMYYAPHDIMVGDWPWMNESKFRYSLTSLSKPEKCVGFARRRMGRGGRVMLDRAHHPHTKQLEKLDIDQDHLPPTPSLQRLLQDIKQNRWKHFKPSQTDRTKLPAVPEGETTSDPVVPVQVTPHKTEHRVTMKVPTRTPHSKSKARQSLNSRPTLKRQLSALDKSSASFATTALLTPSTPQQSTNITRVHSSKLNTKMTNDNFHPKCVTCGGIVTATPSVTNTRTTSFKCSSSETTPRTSTFHPRTTVLPATVTLTTPRGGNHPPGVPALLRISGSGAMMGNTVIYPQLADDAGKHPVTVATTPTSRRGNRSLNVALPASMLTSFKTEVSGFRATQSAPSSPKSLPHDGSNGTVLPTKRGSKTISLNVGNTVSSTIGPALSGNRITIARNKLKVGGGAVFSVALPTNKTISTAPTSGDTITMVSDVNFLSKEVKANTFTESPSSDKINQISISTDTNHLVVPSTASSVVLEPLVTTNSVPVKKPKPAQPMEVT
ncbi:enhancer of polycomb homolog 1 isoform X1 [Ciona intestinalis]